MAIVNRLQIVFARFPLQRLHFLGK
jgi:hypothetical protein